MILVSNWFGVSQDFIAKMERPVMTSSLSFNKTVHYFLNKGVHVSCSGLLVTILPLWVMPIAILLSALWMSSQSCCRQQCWSTYWCPWGLQSSRCNQLLIWIFTFFSKVFRYLVLFHFKREFCCASGILSFLSFRSMLISWGGLGMLFCNVCKCACCFSLFDSYAFPSFLLKLV